MRCLINKILDIFIWIFTETEPCYWFSEDRMWDWICSFFGNIFPRFTKSICYALSKPNFFCVRILRLKLLRLSEFCWEAIQVFLNLNHIKVLSIFVELNFNFHSLKKVNQNWKWIKDRLLSYILFVLIMFCSKYQF